MGARFLREVARAGLPVGPGPDDVVTDGDVRRLPEPAQRYLRFMRVVGRPRDWSFRLEFTGRFRTKPVPEVTWHSADADAFDVALTDRGRTVTGRVTVDERGAPRDFTTTDRFCADPDDPTRVTRARWTTPVTGWQPLDGRQLPVDGRAIWHLPQGPFTYAEFHPVPGSLVFNRAPGQ